MFPGEEVGIHSRNPPPGWGNCPTTEEEGFARPTNLSATEGVTRDGWSDPPIHMSGDWLMWPTQLTSRYDSNAPWAPEANKFERKSFRPQIAFGLELKKKKKKKCSGCR